MLSSDIGTTGLQIVDTKSLPTKPLSLKMDVTVKTVYSIDHIELKGCICKLSNRWTEDGSKLCDFRVILGTEVRE